MTKQNINYYTDLLKEDHEDVLKLNKIVAEAIQQEDLIVQNLKNPPQDILTRGQRLSDKVARFGGSWGFITAFFIVLITWIIFNLKAPRGEIFDPYPFILMNLILSCIAAIQAPIIMMSQNRKEEKDRQRAENDYMVNLKAEIQIRALHQKIDLLMQEQLKKLNETQALQLQLLQQLIKENQKNKN